jgi:hypothetical protein
MLPTHVRNVERDTPPVQVNWLRSSLVLDVVQEEENNARGIPDEEQRPPAAANEISPPARKTQHEEETQHQGVTEVIE